MPLPPTTRTMPRSQSRSSTRNLTVSLTRSPPPYVSSNNVRARTPPAAAMMLATSVRLRISGSFCSRLGWGISNCARWRRSTTSYRNRNAPTAWRTVAFASWRSSIRYSMYRLTSASSSLSGERL